MLLIMPHHKAMSCYFNPGRTSSTSHFVVVCDALSEISSKSVDISSPCSLLAKAKAQIQGMDGDHQLFKKLAYLFCSVKYQIHHRTFKTKEMESIADSAKLPCPVTMSCLLKDFCHCTVSRKWVEWWIQFRWKGNMWVAWITQRF